MTSPYLGNNRYRTFLRAGRTVAGKIAKLDGVVGILGTGSIGRRFGDHHSDLDLIVYAHREAVRELRRLVSVGWACYREVEVDIMVLPYETALKARVPSAFWSQLKRWDQQNSQVMHDTRRRLETMLEQKLVYPDKEREQLLARYKREVHEHLVFYPELWGDRGRLYNVIDTLYRAVQNIVLWIYARNRVFEPYVAKWLFFHLETKAVPEHIYLDALTDVYTKPIRSQAEAMRRRKALLEICDAIGLQWEIYSSAEAHRRMIRNWSSLSEATRRLLEW